MVALSRQFLVLFLVLLQCAAPLVHAHVDDQGLAHGLHLYELEGFQAKPSELFLCHRQGLANVDSAIVSLGVVIKQTAQQDWPDPFALSSATGLVPAQRFAQVLPGASPVCPYRKAPRFDQNLTRAPPVQRSISPAI